MSIGQVIKVVREERGLTQSQFAHELFVTQQALSRWEKGTAEPSIDMIRLISTRFEVPMARLMEMPDNGFCQSCAMPFYCPEDHGTEPDGTRNGDYCNYCYEDGVFLQDYANSDELVAACAPMMAESCHISVEQAEDCMSALLPTSSGGGIRTRSMRWRKGNERWRSIIRRSIRTCISRYHAGLVMVPAMRFVAVDGVGDPNERKAAITPRRCNCFTAFRSPSKMSKKSKNPAEHIDGYFDYTVPPLEGLWSMEKGVPGVDYTRKTDFYWTSMIRLPEFVTDEVFAWAKASFASKHPEVDINRAYLFDFDEGVVAQVMHKGPYDDEPATVTILDATRVRKATGSTSPTPAAITRSTYPTRAEPNRKISKPSSVIR